MLLLPLVLAAQPAEQSSPDFTETAINSAIAGTPELDSYHNTLMQAEQAAQNFQYSKAIKLLRECIEQNDTSAALYTKLAILYFQNRQYVKSLKALCTATEFAPNDPRNFNLMGIVLFYLGNYEQALNAYTRAITLNPSFAVAYYNRGLLRYEMNDKNGSYSDLTKAKELNFEGIDGIIDELFAYRAKK
jgi:Flp pilus assembly protein TadD